MSALPKYECMGGYVLEDDVLVLMANANTSEDDAVELAQRATDCLNACAGMNPAALGDLVKAAEEFIRKCEIGEARSRTSYKQFVDALASLRNQQPGEAL